MQGDAEHIGVWGRTKSGKTTLTKTLIKGRSRVVIFDPMGEYEGVQVEALPAMVEAIADRWGGSFQVAYRPPDFGDPVAHLDAFAEIVRAVQKPYQLGEESRSLTVVVDELAMTFPNVRRASSAFGGLCSRGRHYGIELIGTSQRMADVGTVFRGNTSCDYFLPLRAAVDVGAATDLIGREHVAALRALQNHEYLCFKGGELTRGKNF